MGIAEAHAKIHLAIWQLEKPELQKLLVNVATKEVTKVEGAKPDGQGEDMVPGSTKLSAWEGHEFVRKHHPTRKYWMKSSTLSEAYMEVAYRAVMGANHFVLGTHFNTDMDSVGIFIPELHRFSSISIDCHGFTWI